MAERVPRTVLLGVGLIALASLLFEVALTRIFAVTLWYYFGTLSISMAMLGMAVAAVLCFVRPERFVGKHIGRTLAVFSTAFVILVPIAVWLHLRVPFVGRDVDDPLFYAILALQIALLFLVFLSAGMCISAALFQWSRKVGTVYFFDLVGASLGSLLVVPLLFRVSGPAVTFLVSALGALAGLAFAWPHCNRSMKLAFAGLAVAGIAVFAANDALGILEIRTVKSYGDGLQTTEESRVFEDWSPVSRVAVFAPRRSRDGEVMDVTNDAGAPTLLRKFGGAFDKLGFLARDSREVVHHLKRGRGHALIIGSAGGTDVLASLYFGHQRVTAVEINPVIAELVTERFAAYIGHIFQDPRVTLHVQEGRNFAAGSSDLYDLIQITMIDSWGGAAAGAYIFNENSLYTAEAVSDYWNHLVPDGVLSISRYFGWAEGLRLTNLFVQHLLAQGVKDVHLHLAVITEAEKGYQRATVLMKKAPFTQEEGQLLRDVARAGALGLVYAPYIREGDLVQAEDARTFRRLIHPEAFPGTERAALIAGYPRDISPPTDDRPFFFFTKRLGDLFDTSEEHPARRMAMPILYGTFAMFALVALLSIVLPLRLSRRVDIGQARFRRRLLLYFSLLGIAYLLVEISLIQRLTVFLGHPTYSFVVVLSTLLFSSGLGSYASGRINPRGDATGLLRALGTLLVVLILYVLVVYDVFIGLMALGKGARILLAVGVLLPPGFLMGMAFPMGIQIARRSHEHLVPWGWGVNGAFSVFASICSLVISLNFGLKAGLALGAACYAIAMGIVWTMRQTADGWATQSEVEEEQP